jgi:hypothetical protein
MSTNDIQEDLSNTEKLISHELKNDDDLLALISKASTLTESPNKVDLKNMTEDEAADYLSNIIKQSLRGEEEDKQEIDNKLIETTNEDDVIKNLDNKEYSYEHSFIFEILCTLFGITSNKILEKKETDKNDEFKILYDKS